tara:strand:- start:1009 stop:1134 length:126 start_codon:yes stop_codon:yes gene_type:complete
MERIDGDDVLWGHVEIDEAYTGSEANTASTCGVLRRCLLVF